MCKLSDRVICTLIFVCLLELSWALKVKVKRKEKRDEI